MKQFKFHLALLIILTLAFALRLLIIRDNHFYFTMDQGRDAIYVRDILHGHFYLHGPQASINGIYTGPVWFYLLALAYFFSAGHPIAGVYLLIILNLATVLFISFIFRQKTGPIPALLISAIILFSPAFFESSLYAFNPFLLVSLTLIMIISLALIEQNKTSHFYIAVMAACLSTHSQIAAFIPLFSTCLIVASYLVWQKKLKLNQILLALLICLIIFLPQLIFELKNNFSQLQAGLTAFQSSPEGVAVEQNQFINHLLTVNQTILTLINQSGFQPLNRFQFIILISLAIYYFFHHQKATNSFVKKVALITGLFFLNNFGWFALSTGMRSWHLVALPVIALLLFSLLLSSLPKKIAFLALIILFLCQAWALKKRLIAYQSEYDDQSMLANELAAIDWTYQQSQGQGFRSYIYLPSVKDYPYQYLYWWFGLKKYQYLPCHYAPDQIGAWSYIPHLDQYQKEKKACSNLQYLIIEPALHQSLQDDWYQRVSKKSTLINSCQIGKIKVEKRSL